MSSLEKLSIQGIRSFGVSATDRQEIKFNSPLTLIVGDNGCGKTTIIECLKYALTGEVPPGSNRGQNFIHNPAIFTRNEVRGQVKLKVTNIKGEKLTVIRAMRMSQKRNKWAFETLDSTLNFENEKGEAVSRRIQDVDTEMIQFMGVSKAIINNVLLCHQEDANWPLDEGKKLKEKFDAIFGTTEYNKAIDKLIKMRKDQMAELKVKESDLKHLSYLKKELDDKKLDLERKEASLKSLEESCDKIENEIKELDVESDKLLEVEKEFFELQKKRTTILTELKNTGDQMKSLESKMKKIFDGSMGELETEIEKFHERMDEKRKELSALVAELDKEKIREKRIIHEKQELEKKKSRIVDQRQQEQECLAERATKIKKICELLKKPVLTNDLECRGSVINEQLEVIRDAMSSEEENINDTLTCHEVIEQDLQKVIDDLRVENTKLKTDLESKSKQKIEMEREKSKETQSLASIEADAKLLGKLEEGIQSVDQKMEHMKNVYKFEEEKKKINDKKQQVIKLQNEFSELDKKLDFLNTISEITSQISSNKSKIEEKDQKMKLLKNKHKSNLQAIFGEKSASISENYKRQVSSAYEATQKKITEMNAKINKLKMSQKEFEIKKSNLKDDLKKFEKELADANEKIDRKCGSSNFEDLYAKTKENVEKFQREYSAHKSSESMFKNYISMIQEDPCCPLCHKDLTNEDQSHLNEELCDKIHHLPQEINKFEKKLKDEQKKLESLTDCKPLIEKVKKLEKDIPEMKTKLKNLNVELEKVSNDLENEEIIITEPMSNLELINSMLPDMVLLDNHSMEKEKMSKEVEEMQAQLPKGNHEDIEEVRKKKKDIDEKVKSERSSVAEMEKLYEQNQSNLNTLINRRNDLKEKQIKYQEGVQSLPKIKERIQELSKKLEEISSEIRSLEQQKEPLRKKLENSIKEKDSTKQKNKEILNSMRNSLQNIKTTNNDIQRLTNDLADLEELNLSNAIQHLKESFKKVEKDLSEKETAIKTLLKQIEDLKTLTLSGESEERNLKDNKEYKLLEEKRKKFQEQQEDLNRNVGELDITKAQAKRRKILETRENLQKSKGENAGRKGEIIGQIKKIQNEMSKSELKDAEKNYRTSFYDVEIVKKVINDLGQYRLVLETALMKFHSEKMETINRLIREFWRTIYKGNDIDFIKIHTDVDLVSGTADKKRSFNYRVVQSKNGSLIDMRGSCSAGQKVLASLIIRMALAETFSVNCGVLALDEPTTNLDKKNILALCDALNQLISERKIQQNFMLLVITHDTDFISTLGLDDVYYQVFRDPDRLSQIRKAQRAS